MIQFVLTTLLMVSAGTLLLLVVRSLPRLGEEENGSGKEPLLDRMLASGVPEKVDALVNRVGGKFLRKLNLYSLRAHNYLTERLKKIKTEGGENGKQRIDFKDVSGGE